MNMSTNQPNIPDDENFTLDMTPGPNGVVDGDWMDMQFELYMPRANADWMRARLEESWRPGDAVVDIVE